MKAQRWGRIINTVSNQWPAPKVRSLYSAAKGGIASLTWDLALEGRAYGITANAVSPFAATGDPRESVRARDEALVAAGVLGERRMLATEGRATPEYVSPIVVYLASDHAANVNGRIFRAGAGKIGLYCHPVEIRQVHRDYEKDGPWPVEQLIDLLPNALFAGGENQAPHLL
jgi:NAD(P)-dependent dehydrogenase (short-subunit alcohol dehydrogenase family)